MRTMAQTIQALVGIEDRKSIVIVVKRDFEWGLGLVPVSRLLLRSRHYAMLESKSSDRDCQPELSGHHT